MNNVLSRNCLTCDEKIIIKNNNLKRFCNPICGFKANEFWSKATYEEIIQRWKKYFEKHVVRKDGCWEWKGIVRDGYGALAKGKN